MIAALGDKFTPDEAAIIEVMLREYAGTIPALFCTGGAATRKRRLS